MRALVAGFYYRFFDWYLIFGRIEINLTYIREHTIYTHKLKEQINNNCAIRVQIILKIMLNSRRLFLISIHLIECEILIMTWKIIFAKNLNSNWRRIFFLYLFFHPHFILITLLCNETLAHTSHISTIYIVLVSIRKNFMQWICTVKKFTMAFFSCLNIGFSISHRSMH